MAERKTGAGSRLSGVLERSTPLNPGAEPDEPEHGGEPSGPPEGEPAEAAKGRGGAPRKPRSADARASRRIKGRTIYLPDDLFERIMVQAHRRDKTISEYVASVLDRQVPDHRVVRAEPSPDAGPS